MELKRDTEFAANIVSNKAKAALYPASSHYCRQFNKGGSGRFFCDDYESVKREIDFSNLRGLFGVPNKMPDSPFMNCLKFLSVEMSRVSAAVLQPSGFRNVYLPRARLF